MRIFPKFQESRFLKPYDLARIFRKIQPETLKKGKKFQKSEHLPYKLREIVKASIVEKICCVTFSQYLISRQLKRIFQKIFFQKSPKKRRSYGIKISDEWLKLVGPSKKIEKRKNHSKILYSRQIFQSL